VRPESLDHVALWVAQRDAIADFLTRHVGMHVVDRSDTFTLVGSDARRGKLTLFDAEGPRERGALKHVALRVADLRRAAEDVRGHELERPNERELFFDVHEGLRLGLVEARTDIDYDLDHVALFSLRPAETADAYRNLGFAPAEPDSHGVPRVEVGGAFVEFHEGDPGDSGRPLLNHLAVRVESAEDHIAEAKEIGLDVADVVDAANTYALFVWGPERVKIEYVEHKPTFSLT
jgi:catechol 2,3-dioxygenase-like lactoylglutathione lyase family enzyme